MIYRIILLCGQIYSDMTIYLIIFSNYKRSVGTFGESDVTKTHRYRRYGNPQEMNPRNLDMHDLQ